MPLKIRLRAHEIIVVNGVRIQNEKNVSITLTFLDMVQLERPERNKGKTVDYMTKHDHFGMKVTPRIHTYFSPEKKHDTQED